MRLTAVQAELMSAKEALQTMLDNISNFGARVYRRWNLPQNFARKIQEWVTINKDKVDKTQEQWVHEKRGEEVSSSDVDEEDEAEDLNLEDSDNVDTEE